MRSKGLRVTQDMLYLLQRRPGRVFSTNARNLFYSDSSQIPYLDTWSRPNEAYKVLPPNLQNSSIREMFNHIDRITNGRDLYSLKGEFWTSRDSKTLSYLTQHCPEIIEGTNWNQDEDYEQTHDKTIRLTRDMQYAKKFESPNSPHHACIVAGGIPAVVSTYLVSRMCSEATSGDKKPIIGFIKPPDLELSASGNNGGQFHANVTTTYMAGHGALKLIWSALIRHLPSFIRPYFPKQTNPLHPEYPIVSFDSTSLREEPDIFKVALGYFSNEIKARHQRFNGHRNIENDIMGLIKNSGAVYDNIGSDLREQAFKRFHKRIDLIVPEFTQFTDLFEIFSKNLSSDEFCNEIKNCFNFNTEICKKVTNEYIKEKDFLTPPIRHTGSLSIALTTNQKDALLRKKDLCNENGVPSIELNQHELEKRGLTIPPEGMAVRHPRNGIFSPNLLQTLIKAAHKDGVEIYNNTVITDIVFNKNNTGENCVCGIVVKTGNEKQFLRTENLVTSFGPNIKYSIDSDVDIKPEPVIKGTGFSMLILSTAKTKGTKIVPEEKAYQCNLLHISNFKEFMGDDGKQRLILKATGGGETGKYAKSTFDFLVHNLAFLGNLFPDFDHQVLVLRVCARSVNAENKLALKEHGVGWLDQTGAGGTGYSISGIYASKIAAQLGERILPVDCHRSVGNFLNNMIADKDEPPVILNDIKVHKVKSPNLTNNRSY